MISAFLVGFIVLTLAAAAIFIDLWSSVDPEEDLDDDE